jgi:hypothetical protein
VGNDSYWYANPENTFYGWMQKHFLATIQWSVQQLKTQGYVYWNGAEQSRMTEEILASAFKCGDELPPVKHAEQILSPNDFENILRLIEQYGESGITRKDSWDPLFKEKLNGLSTTTDCMHYHHFAKIYTYLWPDHPQTPIIGVPCASRPYIHDNPAYLPDINEYGYWTAEECQAIARQIEGFYNPQHKDFLDLKKRVFAYYELQKKKHPQHPHWYSDLEKKYDYEVQDLAERVASQLLDLEPGEGIITEYSY